MKRLLAVLLILTSVVWQCEGLSCLTCSEVNCPSLPACKWGVGKDVCGCCDVCLKGPGESCGGTFGEEGTCGTGLTCRTRKTQNTAEIAVFPPVSAGKCRRDRD